MFHAAFSVSATSSGPHDRFEISYRGVLVGSFGILRGSKKDKHHDWIPRQIHLTSNQADRFARCPMSIDEYIEVLKDKKHVSENIDEPN